MQEFHVDIFGFDYFKDLYQNDVYFREAFEAWKNSVSRDTGPWRELMLQDDFLFKKIELFIPCCSTRENLMHEKKN